MRLSAVLEDLYVVRFIALQAPVYQEAYVDAHFPQECRCLPFQSTQNYQIEEHLCSQY